MFTVEECNKISKNCSDNGYVSLFFAFGDKLKAETDEKSIAKYRVLYQLCLLCQDFETRSFKPGYAFERRSSYSLDTFSDKELDFLQEISSSIDDGILKARIYDVLWLRRKNINNAVLALEQYKGILINQSTFCEKAEGSVERLLSICTSIYRNKQDERDKILDYVLCIILDLHVEQSLFAEHLIEIFLHYTKQYRIAEIIQKLEEIVEFYLNQKNGFDAARCTERIIACYHPVPPPVVYLESAKHLQSAAMLSNPLCMFEILHKAKSFLHKIPNSSKAALDVSALLQEIESQIEACRPMMEAECTPIQIQTSFKKPNESYLHDLFDDSDPFLVIKNLANLLPLYNLESELDAAISSIEQHPLQAIFSSIHIDGGRKVFSAEAVDINNPLSISDSKVEEALYLRYLLHVDVSSSIYIQTALEYIKSKHYITESVFSKIAKYNIFFSYDDTRIIAKALYCGFSGDYITSLHLLSFKLETFIRNILNHNRVPTILVKRGIEDEKSLNALLKQECIVNLLGKHLAFELSALFTHHLGLNIRNKIAHGLTTYSDYHSSSYVYAWWFLLRLSFRIYDLVNEPSEFTISANSSG